MRRVWHSLIGHNWRARLVDERRALKPQAPLTPGGLLLRVFLRRHP